MNGAILMPDQMNLMEERETIEAEIGALAAIVRSGREERPVARRRE